MHQHAQGWLPWRSYPAHQLTLDNQQIDQHTEDPSKAQKQTLLNRTNRAPESPAERQVHQKKDALVKDLSWDHLCTDQLRQLKEN